MKSLKNSVLTSFLILQFISCEQNPEKTNSSNTQDSSNKTTASDSIHPKENSGSSNAYVIHTCETDLDTIFQLQIQKKNYQLVLSHETPSDNGGLTTTVRIVEKNAHDTLFNKTFYFNTVGELSHPAPDSYWLTLYNSAGGSGWTGTLYHIKFTPKITLQPILNYDELSYWKINRTATELIFFQGIWKMIGASNDTDFESHFSEHQQLISICKIKEDSILIQKIGQSKHKYDFFENPTQGFIEFKQKEPAFGKFINWADYD